MAIAKVVEVNSSSNKSFEDAIQTGIQKVTETVKNVQGAWINEQKVVIKENKITEYRVNLKISFLVGGKTINMPTTSVANPGKIKSIAAKARAAPDMIS